VKPALYSSLLLCCGLACLAGCENPNSTGRNATSAQDKTGSQTKADGSRPIEVVATVGMVADLVREVGQDRVRVVQICGSGVDPHLHKPLRDDVKLFTEADMIYYSGLLLEGKMTDILIKMARSKPVIAVTESIDESLLLEPEELEGHYDPHVWMDVSAWAKCVDVVEETLSDFDPEFTVLAQQKTQNINDAWEILKDVLPSGSGKTPD